MTTEDPVATGVPATVLALPGATSTTPDTRPRRKRRIRLGLLIAVACVFGLSIPLLYVGLEEIVGHLFGPWAEPATATNVVGTWRGPARSKLVFTSDGRFTSADLPSSMFASFRKEWSSCHGGTWTIGPAGAGGPGVPPQVEVDFAGGSCGSFGTQMQMERLGSGATALFYYVGDPDEDAQIQFLKQP